MKGFPYEYYRGEILSDVQAGENRKALKRFLVAMGFSGIIFVSSQKPARAVLPEADGFTANPQQISPYGRPRMRGQTTPSPLLSAPPTGPIRRPGRVVMQNDGQQCQEKFIREDKFEQLSRNPETGKIDKKSTTEAVTIMQAEYKSLVYNPRRPNLKAGDQNLDFVIDGPKPYKFVDVKNPMDPKNFPNSKGQTESIAKMANRMGTKITQQKGGSNEVLHIVDLENLASATKPEFCKKLIEAAGSSEAIKFIN